MSPLEFYRVQHDTSRVRYSSNTGFTSEKPLAGNSYSLRMSLDDDLIYEFEAHCNKHHVPTALISMCSSADLALERAHQEERYGRTGVRIYKIYAGYKTYVGGGQPRIWNWYIDPFSAQEFAKRVQAKHKVKVIDEWNWEYLEDEYLVLNTIPRAAVAEASWNVQQFEKCMYIPDIWISEVENSTGVLS